MFEAVIILACFSSILVACIHKECLILLTRTYSLLMPCLIVDTHGMRFVKKNIYINILHKMIWR